MEVGDSSMKQRLKMVNCFMRIVGFTKDNTSFSNQRNTDKKGAVAFPSVSIVLFSVLFSLSSSGVITSISQSEVSHS